MKNNKILGIDPGTRETGFAILSSRGLFDYGVENFTHRKTRKTLLSDVDRWLEKMIRFHRPKILVIEKSNLIRIKSSRNLKYLVERIEKIAKSHRIGVVELAPKSVRKILFGDGWGTKKETAKFIAHEHYPELRKFLNRGSKWQEQYWSNMFDAVAVALAYLKKHNK